MKRIVTAEELEPGLKIHIEGRVLTVHTAAYFWPGEKTGFFCARDHEQRTAATFNVQRGERLLVE